MLHRPRAWKSDPRDESRGHISLVAMTPGWKHATEEASPSIFRAALAKRGGSHYHQRWMMIISDVLSLSTPRRRRNAMIKKLFPEREFSTKMLDAFQKISLSDASVLLLMNRWTHLDLTNFIITPVKSERIKARLLSVSDPFFCCYNNLICSWREFFFSS